MARLPRLLSLVALAVPLHGCAGAPSLSLFGAYFPLWLLSALVTWRIFLTTGWADTVRWQLLVNTAIGLIIAEIVWLIGTGHFP
jgi:hypothetical protein